MGDKDDLAVVVEREGLPQHKRSFDIRKVAAGLVDGAGSAVAGAVATVQKVADGAMRAAAPMADDALAAIADAADGAAGAAAVGFVKRFSCAGAECIHILRRRKTH